MLDTSVIRVLLVIGALAAAIALGTGIYQAIGHTNKANTNQIQQYQPGAAATPLPSSTGGAS
jgi:hypothetical protein